MNCKPGDLAIIVRCGSVTENIGRIVEVLRAGGEMRGHPLWVVGCPSPLIAVVPETGQRVPRHSGLIPDAWLRPVSGLPVDEKAPDEVTA